MLLDKVNLAKRLTMETIKNIFRDCYELYLKRNTATAYQKEQIQNDIITRYKNRQISISGTVTDVAKTDIYLRAKNIDEILFSKRESYYDYDKIRLSLYFSVRFSEIPNFDASKINKGDCLQVNGIVDKLSGDFFLSDSLSVSVSIKGRSINSNAYDNLTLSELGFNKYNDPYAVERKAEVEESKRKGEETKRKRKETNQIIILVVIAIIILSGLIAMYFGHDFLEGPQMLFYGIIILFIVFFLASR